MEKINYTDEELRRMVEFASEELRQALNSIMSRHNLEPASTLFILARITAAYIHQTQKAYDNMGAEEVIEELYQQMLTSHLTDMDMSDASEGKGVDNKVAN